MEQFHEIYETYKYIIPLAIKKCRIYKNFDHYEQVGMESLWRAYLRFNGDMQDFGKYAFPCVKNDLLNELKKMAHYENHHVPTDNETLALNERVDVTTPDYSEQVATYLEPVTDQDKKLLMALYGYNYTYEEIAAMFKLSVHGVKKRRDRALQKIRNHYKPKNT